MNKGMLLLAGASAALATASTQLYRQLAAERERGDQPSNVIERAPAR